MLKRIRELLASKRIPKRKDAAPAPAEEPAPPPQVGAIQPVPGEVREGPAVP